MTTTVAKSGAIRTPPTAAVPRSRAARRRALTLAVIILTLAVVSVGMWLIVDRVAGRSATPVSAATPVPSWTPIASPWLERLDVIRLRKQLVRTGYSIKVDGNLDPVTKSALADYLQLDAAHPLNRFLADALEGTVITGFRNPMAWNRRFGLHRLTRFVERPLTGPGGQLDTNGNLRAPIAATPARLRARPAGPRNGKIAFVDRTNALDVINPNGSALRRLARCPVAITSCVIGGFAWSPNGKQLAFLRGHAGGAITANNLSLYVINADGTGTRRLAHCGNCDQWSPVAWSPDGSSIVFAGDDGLHLISASTGTQVHLTHSGTDVDPAWSPNGSTIAFVRGDSLYAIRSDGSAIAELAPADAIRHPAWAPDGTKIAFDGPDQIYVVGADGSQLKLLRGGSLGSGPGTPSWSPDGEHILFFNTPGTPGAFTAEVWVMRPDGSDQRRLYHSRCCVGEWYAPIWSPNGKSIAFSADSAGGIFLMNANGSHRRRLSQSATEIAWQSSAEAWTSGRPRILATARNEFELFERPTVASGKR